ncbi:CGNR zinc finger domain-containing protein [Streptomyces sp. NPDC059568]|uniref:CGNR zinc finger domain-containing protein n=1 Tax=Streptomyces sp. NPDC059568 TaxID=3346868 RepID=UPI00369E660B
MDHSGGRVRSNKQTRGQGRTKDFPRLLGERLCLHFVNTVEGPASGDPVDFLSGYADLVRWSWHADAITEAESGRLLDEAGTRPGEAAEVYGRALALRAACDEVFRAVARSVAPGERDLGRIRTEYLAALAHARLCPADGGGFEWSRSVESDDLGRVLWPVARSAVELLTGADFRRLKECPGAGDCGWLFYDTSRNGTRRWCSMEGCGSRVKMRRHYVSRLREAHDTGRDQVPGL